MKDLFKGFYKLNSNELERLWETATFVFDTNVLTNLYRYQESTVKELYDVMEEIKDRLWLPYHVGLEFHRNRFNVISEQHHLFTKVENKINDSIKKLNDNLNSLSLHKRHSVIDPTAYLNEISKITDRYTETLNNQKEKSLTLQSDDETLNRLEIFFKGKIGKPPANQKEMDELFKEGEKRYANKIPPGFADLKDKQNKDDFTYGGITYKPIYGDLIVWNQIKNHAKNNKVKNLIFVTDDSKEDWWWIINSEGKNTIGIRPELRDELINETGVNLFNAYSFKSFLVNAKNYLKVDITDDAINEVKEIYDLDFSSMLNKQLFRNENNMGSRKFYANNDGCMDIVYQWVVDTYPYATLTDHKYADFIEQKGRHKRYIFVKDIKPQALDISALNQLIQRYLGLFNLKDNEQFTFIFSNFSETKATQLTELISQLHHTFINEVEFVIGYVDSEVIDEETSHESFEVIARHIFKGNR